MMRMKNGGSSYHRLVFTSSTSFLALLGPWQSRGGLEGVRGGGCSKKAKGVCRGEVVVHRAVCRSSELTLSATGEKGKGALGVPQMKEVGGKKADLTHHIL